MSADESAVFLRQECLLYAVPGALRMAAEIRVADHLVDGPRTAEQLAEQTGTHADALRRVLRLLVTRGIFHEDAAGRFHLTPLAEALRTDCPTSMRDGILFSTSPLFWQPAGDLAFAVRTGAPVVERIFGKSFYEYLAENPVEARIFDLGMAQCSRFESRRFAETYDFADAGLLVDVGGGRGRLLIEVLRRHPGWSGVLFDQAHVVENHELATLGAEDRWDVVSGDFFEEVPPGGDLYSMEFILHDWDDQCCARILSNCRRAMKPNSRIVVLDVVIPEGEGAHTGKTLDVVMLASFPGKERTEAEFAALFDTAGLRLNRVIPIAEGGLISVIEAVPRRPE